MTSQLPAIFPGPLASEKSSPVALSAEGAAACVCACQLMEATAGALRRARQGSLEMKNLQLHLFNAFQGWVLISLFWPANGLRHLVLC